MPYIQYLTSASTGSYPNSTYSFSSLYASFGSSSSSSTQYTLGCGPFGASNPPWGSGENQDGGGAGFSSSAGANRQRGLYSSSAITTSRTVSFQSFSYYAGCAETGDNGGSTFNANVVNSASRTIILSDNAGTISGDNVQKDENNYETNSFATRYSFTANWVPSLTNLTYNGTISFITYYSGDYVTGTTLTNTFFAGLPAWFNIYKTVVTTSRVSLRKTTRGTGTIYGPLGTSSRTYTSIAPTTSSFTLTNIKTTVVDNAKIYWDVERQTKFFKIEWIGYAGSGSQNLGLIYTETAVSKNISPYDKVMMETETFSSSNKRTVFSYGSSFSGGAQQATYTLTYDNITTATVRTTITSLRRTSREAIDFFTYGFINTTAQVISATTAGTRSSTTRLFSSSLQDVGNDSTSLYLISGVSYSHIQEISTTSNFTQFVELSGLNRVTSFIVRSFVTTTAPFVFRSNASVQTNSGDVFDIPPVFPQTQITIRTPEDSNPDTFYTERASVASFAEPDYAIAYRNYSPADASQVFLALVPLKTIGGNPDGDLYPSWISVYDGTFTGDRAVTSNQSVTVSQTASYVGSGATNVYQTITYFINNNSNSQTTKTTSIAMAIVSQATLVTRLVRTAVENLDSAYTDAYSPPIPITATNVFFTQGLQGGASYNMNRLLLNAYTSVASTFAGAGVSTFPISVSSMSPIYRNQIRIDSVYSNTGFNSFGVNLLQFRVD
jgi:hypothetical protein